MPALPSHVGRYRVLGLLGQGAMGVVYHAHDDGLERDVAVKVMSVGASDPDGRARFLREARAAARLQHPNIVTIYELGEHEGAPFMVLELLEGVDLQRAIEAGLRPDPKVTLPVVLQVLAGLDHAHAAGIVHRDIKPSNVFLPQRRPAKIMDFGVARLAGGATTKGLVVGTPNYMSPEQVGGGDLDGRSDLFSAGLILYELVTGERAYRGDTVIALAYKILHEEPDLGLIPRGAQWDRLRAVIERALRKKPEERFPDAHTMAAELSDTLRELGGDADATTSLDPALLRPRGGPGSGRTLRRDVAAAVEAAPPTAAGPAPVARTDARPMTPLVLGGVGVAALVLAGVVLLFRREPLPSGPPATTPSSFAPASATASVPSSVPAATAPASVPASVPTSVAASLPAPALPTASAGPGSQAPSSAGASPAPNAIASTAPVASASPAGAAAPVSSTGARLDRANQLMEQGRYAQALAEARAVSAREPANAEARILVQDAEAALVIEDAVKAARTALKAGDRDAALVEIRRGLAVNPSEGRLLSLFREATQ